MLPAIIIIVLIVLFLLIPVGIAADYDKDGLRMSAMVSFTHFKIHPHFKPKKEEDLETKNKKKKSRKLILNFSIEEWFEVAKIAVKALGRFRKSICFDRIKVIYISANPDPSVAATRYNAVITAVNTVTPLFEKAFKIKEREVSISTDYDAEVSYGEFGATLSVRVGQVLYIALLAVFAFGVVYFKNLIKKHRERKAISG